MLSVFRLVSSLDRCLNVIMNCRTSCYLRVFALSAAGAVWLAMTSYLCPELFYTAKLGGLDIGSMTESSGYLLGCKIESAFAPRLSYEAFKNILSDPESAKISIEYVDCVGTNYDGNFLSVRFVNSGTVYRIDYPESKFEEVIQSLSAAGVATQRCFSCL
jgi:hypothetical protein